MRFRKGTVRVKDFPGEAGSGLRIRAAELAFLRL